MVDNARSIQHWAYCEHIFFDVLSCIFGSLLPLYIGVKHFQCTREWFVICVGETNHQGFIVLLCHGLGKSFARENLWISSELGLDKLCTLTNIYFMVHLWLHNIHKAPLHLSSSNRVRLGWGGGGWLILLRCPTKMGQKNKSKIKWWLIFSWSN